jgi:peptidyl-prolyl cis-trans isomerase C
MWSNFRRALGYFGLLLCCSFLVSPSFADDKAVSGGDEKVASVNGKVITQAELEREILNLSHRYSIQMQDATIPDDIESKALDSLITRELLYETSQKAQIKVEDSEVDANLQQAISRFPNKEAFESVLKRENVTEDELKSEIRYGLAIQKYIEDVYVSKTSVSDEESKTYYDSNPELFKHPEMVKASHILIRVDSQAEEAQKIEAQKKIEDIAKKLAAGEDFAELAKTYSECPSSSNGGDLGTFGQGQMVQAFEDAAFTLKPGEVSPIVETHFGFHIIKVSEKQPEGSFPLDQVKPQIQQVLTREKVQKLLEKDIENLKSKANIETFSSINEKPKIRSRISIEKCGGGSNKCSAALNLSYSESGNLFCT